jgi:predicted alpha/beta hydrolase
MNVENIEIGIEFPPFDIPVRLYRAVQPQATAIVVPAMGTSAGFYVPFAQELASRGLSVLSPELPGTGESLPRPSWSVNYGYRDLVDTYLPGLVAAARGIDGSRPLILLGHSLGAHAGTLAVATGSVEIDALVTIAGGNIHYRNWNAMGAVKVLFAAGLFSSLARLCGHMPGQYVGFGGPQARRLIVEWAKLIRTGRFSHLYDEAGFSASAPALCIGYAQDDFAPPQSVASLASLLGADVEVMQMSWPGNPHSSWARNPAKTVGMIIRWLAARELIRQMPG